MGPAATLARMTDRISAATKGLLTLSLFFVCATLGAALALFAGWPVAILSGVVGFVVVQQVAAAFARRRDKRAAARNWRICARCIWNSKARSTTPAAAWARSAAMIESRAGAQEKKIVAELQVLETLMRDFAGKISRQARAPCRCEPQKAAARPGHPPISRRWMARARCWKPSAPAWKKTASIFTCSPSSACRSASCVITRRCRACATTRAR